jgi:hypothetical protein
LRYHTLALAIFFSAPIHASPKCDADALNFLNYYFITLPEKLMSATPKQLAQKVVEERERAKEQQVSFYDTCLWQEMVKGKEPHAQYREIDRIFTNIDSYLAALRTTQNRNEVKFMLGRYCEFMSKGITKFPGCKVRSAL